MSSRNTAFTKSKPSKRGGANRLPTANLSKSSMQSRKAAPVSKALKRYTARDPTMISNGGSVRITHREFVCDVTGQTAFTALSFPINPGRDTLFTWLPDIAARYERYQFEKICFHYEPRCSTATAGTVILAVDYDALDSAPSSKQNVYAYHHSAQSSAWDDCALSVEPQILTNRGPLFVRTGAAPSVSDLKTYDLGNLWLCVSGFSGAVACGELFVEYSVSLRIPQIQNNVQYGSLVSAGTISASAYFGTTSVPSGLLDISVSPTTITFNQAFSGQIDLYVTGTGLTAGGYANTGTCTSAFLSDLVNAGSTSMQVAATLVALRGQTWIPAVTNTTVSATTTRFFPTS